MAKGNQNGKGHYNDETPNHGSSACLRFPSHVQIKPCHVHESDLQGVPIALDDERVGFPRHERPYTVFRPTPPQLL